MTDRRPDRPFRDLIRHTAIYGLGNAVLSVLGLLLVPIYTHHLTPAEFGLLALLLALSGLLTSLYDLGMMNSVGRSYFDARAASDPRAELRLMSTTAQLFLLTYGALLTIALWAFAGPISTLVTGTAAHAGLLRLVFCTLLANALTIVPLTLVRMEERARYFVVLTGLRFAGALALNIVFVVWLGWGVQGILLGNAVMAAALIIALAPEFVRILGPKVSMTVAGQMLAFGLPYLPVLVSGWLIDSSDRYLLEVLTSREQVGQYALGYKVAQVVQLVVATFSMGWAPLRYRIYERADAREIYRKLTSYYVIAAGFLTVAVSLVATEVVAVIAPSSYAPAAVVVPSLALAYAVYGLFILAVTGMGVAKRTAPMAGIAMAGAAANVGLNLVLIPRYGMLAAAHTTIVANVILAAGAWYCSEKVYPIPQDWRLMLRVLVIGAAVVWLDRLLQPTGIVAGAALATLLLFVFVGLLFTSRAIRRSDVGAAQAWLRDVVMRSGS
jgi:O-antigen/teichoic acid export membrane protein